MKKWSICFFVFLSFAVATTVVCAQSNQHIDRLLKEEEATLGNLAYLVLTASGEIGEETSPDEAAETVFRQGWKFRVKDSDQPLRLGEYSYLIMKAFDLQGGLFYTLFPTPRYAVRELSFRGFITSRPAAYRTLSGEEAIRILGRVLEWREEAGL